MQGKDKLKRLSPKFDEVKPSRNRRPEEVMQSREDPKAEKKRELSNKPLRDRKSPAQLLKFCTRPWRFSKGNVYLV